VNARTFELASAGACQVVDLKEELAALFKPGEEVVVYRTCQSSGGPSTTTRAPDEARAIAPNRALRRARAEHTLRHRIDEMLFAVEERFGSRSASLARELRCRSTAGPPTRSPTARVRHVPGPPRAHLRPRAPQARPGAPHGTGLWRYAPLLPIADPRTGDLGEGGTPLLDARAGRAPGVRRLLLKYDGAKPDRHRQGPLVGDRRRAPPAVRLPPDLGRELGQRGVVDRGLCARRAFAR